MEKALLILSLSLISLVSFAQCDREFEERPKILSLKQYTMEANTNYLRVLPRDLFNESKLLKCIGRLCLLIHDEITPVKMSFEGADDGFIIGRFDDGSLTVTNLDIFIRDQVFTFKTVYNSRSNYPLVVQDIDFAEYRVFDENGEFDSEFIDFLKRFTDEL